jgi:hypothetical protein
VAVPLLSVVVELDVDVPSLPPPDVTLKLIVNPGTPLPLPSFKTTEKGFSVVFTAAVWLSPLLVALLAKDEGDCCAVTVLALPVDMLTTLFPSKPLAALKAIE